MHWKKELLVVMVISLFFLTSCGDVAVEEQLEEKQIEVNPTEAAQVREEFSVLQQQLDLFMKSDFDLGPDHYEILEFKLDKIEKKEVISEEKISNARGQLEELKQR